MKEALGPTRLEITCRTGSLEIGDCGLLHLGGITCRTGSLERLAQSQC